MGTWDISIEGNDTFQDIYSNFMGRYNAGSRGIRENLRTTLTIRNYGRTAQAISQGGTSDIKFDYFGVPARIIANRCREFYWID